LEDRYQVPILGKTFAIIELISQNADGIGFSRIVSTLGEPKTTVFRILQTLEKNHWVEKRGDLYSLGYMFIHYGLTTLARRDIRARALPYLEELTAAVRESSHLAVLSGKMSMILEVVESPQHIKPVSRIGTLLPMHCTSHGKILLAFGVSAPVREFLAGEVLERKTEHTITDLDALQKEIDRVRAQGYAMDDQEFFGEVRCLAAPVWGPDRKCIGALGMTATSFSFPSEKVDEYADIVRSIAGGLSREMGGN
jgi:DNA-binding IclR family transcriptional regulator